MAGSGSRQYDGAEPGHFERGGEMGAFWVVLLIVMVVIVGNALVLLRTAKKPKIPDSVKRKPADDEEGGW